MTGVMVLVILLPVVPVSIEGYLHDLFDIFARIAGLITRKPANSPDIFMLHLHIGVYVLFLRLYGMFPCNFLSFLRVHYAKKENLMVYNDIIAPMLEKVRFHPNLVSGSKDAETSKSRWRKVEPQDIVVNCAKLSLDPIEGTTEDLQCPIIPRSKPDIVTAMKPPSKQQRPQDKPWQEKMEAVSEMFPVVIDPASYGFSPSQALGLSTPPTSQRATPAASYNDLTASLPQSTGGTVSASPQIVTPTPEVHPREMPVMGDDAERGQGQNQKVTPVLSRLGPMTTPVGFHRTSAFTSPYVWRPVSSQTSSSAPSPIKPNLSSDSLNAQFDLAAARSLHFDKIPESQDESAPRHIQLRIDKDIHVGAAGAAGPVPVHTLPQIVRTLTTHDSDTLDQEVSRITEVDEDMESLSSCGGASDDGAGAKHLKTADSVIQFMKKVNRIRFNSLTSHNSEPLVFTPEKHSHPGRARSCPPLRRKPLSADPSHNVTFTTSYANNVNSKLDTVSESAVAIHARNDAGGETSFLSTQLSQELCKSFSSSKDGSEASSSGHTRTCTCQCGVGAKEGGENPLRHVEMLASMFQCMLAPVKVAVCRQCQHPMIGWEPGEGHHGAAKSGGAETWIKWSVAERALYSMLSPPELLDRHLAQGSELHAKGLAHIPLTSSDNISWTHFGGGPPQDEINILRGEILLLQNQVMYERHKRSNHAMRNRRLLRRIAHVSALEEQVQALSQQLEDEGKDVQNLQVSLKLLQDENHKLLQEKDSDEYERLVDFKTTIQQNKDLAEANVELKNLLLTQKAENDELKTELQQVRAKSFELEKYNDMLRSDMASVHKWKSQVIQLQKEMLLMGEAQDRLQNHLQQQQRMGQENSVLASEMLIHALKAEMKGVKRENMRLTLTLEATQCRLMDLDEFSKSKDVVMGEVRNTFEEAKAKHAEELQAVDEKYRSMLHINQQVDAQVLKLQAENDCLQQKLVSSQLRASRNRDKDRGQSPGAGGGGPSSQTSSPAREESQSPKAETSSGKEEAKGTGEREGGGALPERYEEPRRMSRQSKDSGRGSMLTSGQFIKSASIEESTSSKTASRNSPAPACPSDSKLCAESSKAKANSPTLPKKGGEVRGKKKKEKKAGVREQQTDTTSQSSDGPQGLAASRAMMYTDSEDNASHSSNSNLTTDSGVYSKVEHANLN
ncbi:hypothetical protein V1264_006720 [Littorina saxatilis]